MNIIIYKELPDFISFLMDRLKKSLPGYEAHRQMEPTMNNKQFRSYIPNSDTRRSAILVLLTLNNEANDYEVLLTLRSNNISHSGQISCPGGLSERDEAPHVTALREAEEEIGLNTENLQIVGNLTDLYVQPSNSLITPVLAFTNSINDLIVNKNEVEEVFFVKLNTLLDDKVFKKEIWNLNGYDVDVPFWNIHHSTPLWGATAMILKELLLLYTEFELLNEKLIKS